MHSCCPHLPWVLQRLPDSLLGDFTECHSLQVLPRPQHTTPLQREQQREQQQQQEQQEQQTCGNAVSGTAMGQRTRRTDCAQVTPPTAATAETAPAPRDQCQLGVNSGRVCFHKHVRVCTHRDLFQAGH
jgi:hypothetical protein